MREITLSKSRPYDIGYSSFTRAAYYPVTHGGAYVESKHRKAVTAIIYKNYCPFKRGTKAAKQFFDGWNAAVRDEIEAWEIVF